MPKRNRWQEWDNSAPTDVDKWLALYAEDDNTFWATDSGHIMNVVDELIERLSTARADEREKAAQRAKAEVMSLSTAELLAYNFDDTREVRSMIAARVAAAVRGLSESERRGHTRGCRCVCDYQFRSICTDCTCEGGAAARGDGADPWINPTPKDVHHE